MDAADVAEIFDKVDVPSCIALFRLVPQVQRTELFSYLSFDRQEELLDRLPDVVVTSLLNQMEPADRTQLFEDLDEVLRDKLIEKLTFKERAIAEKLLAYPEGSVGRLMSPEFIALREEMKATEALNHLRWYADGYTEAALHHLFVVDSSSKLLGHVSLASLVVADPSSALVKSLMDSPQPSLRATADEEEAAGFFRKYDTPYIPIVDDKDVLVGIVEAEAAFDVAEEEATEDIQQFGGQATLEDSYFQTSTVELIKKRAGWLALLFLGTMFTTNAMEHFEAVVKAASILVMFLPLIVSSGGNSGSQAASLMIRSLAVKEVSLRDWYRVLFREIAIGACLGLILGVLGYARAVIGGQGQLIGVVLACSLVGIVTFGAIIGSMLPLLLKALRLDPAVSSSPAIASVVDVVGIFIFFNIAIIIMHRYAGISF
jgi:magnesium transporter